MSLMPLRGIDGGILVDLGYYHAMAASAREMNRHCVNGIYRNGKGRGYGKMGGFTHVGTAFTSPQKLFPSVICHTTAFPVSYQR